MRKGTVAAIFLGLLLIAFALFVLFGELGEQRWTGQRALELYSWGTNWRGVQFLVHVAGRNTFYSSTSSFANSGGLSDGACWNEELGMMEWWKESSCDFATYDDLERSYAEHFSTEFDRHLQTQFALLPFSVTYPHHFTVTPSFADSPWSNISVRGTDSLHISSPNFTLDMPLRFEDSLRYSFTRYLDIRQQILSHADCFIRSAENGDFSSCALPGWQVSMQEESLIFIIPGGTFDAWQQASIPLVTFDSQRNILIQFAINLNSLKSRSSPHNLFGEPK